MDAASGEQGSGLLLYKCGSTSYTEGWRGGENEMRIYSARYSGNFPNPLGNIGHTFVGVAKYDRYNYIYCYTTFSLWPEFSIGKDNDSSNNNQTSECNDKSNRGWWDDVHVNGIEEYGIGLTMTSTNNFTYPNGTSNYFSYWQKNITQNQYADMMNTGYQPPYTQYNVIPGFTWNVCTSYSAWLWNKYGGAYTPLAGPNLMYYQFLSTAYYRI
jgi:hypothetical protein